MSEVMFPPGICLWVWDPTHHLWCLSVWFVWTMLHPLISCCACDPGCTVSGLQVLSITMHFLPHSIESEDEVRWLHIYPWFKWRQSIVLTNLRLWSQHLEKVLLWSKVFRFIGCFWRYVEIVQSTFLNLKPTRCPIFVRYLILFSFNDPLVRFKIYRM